MQVYVLVPILLLDKNHNPRKGTDKKSSLIFVFSFFVENFDKLGCFMADNV